MCIRDSQEDYNPRLDNRWVPLVKLIVDMVILKIYEGQYAESDQIYAYRDMKKKIMMEREAVQGGTSSTLRSHWRKTNISSVTATKQGLSFPSYYSGRPGSAAYGFPSFPKKSLETKYYTLSEIDTSALNTEEYRYEFYEHSDGIQWLVKRIKLMT